MTKKWSIILAVGGLVLGATAFQAKPANVAGDWEFSMAGGPGGPPGGGDMPKMTITFVQKGEALEASMTTPMGEMKGTGKVVGNEIEFTFTMTGGPMGDMTIVHKGKVEGDTMKGTMTMGDMGEREWSAERVKK